MKNLYNLVKSCNNTKDDIVVKINTLSKPDKVYIII